MSELLAAAEALPEPNVIVTALATVLVALIGGVFAYLGTRARVDPAGPQPAPVVAPSPLANFSGTQNEFMALVIQDNQAIRSELAGVQAEVRELRTSLEAARRTHTAFELAVRRYLELLARAWAGPDPMPWPSEDDLGVLRHTLPRSRRPPT